MVKQEKSSNYVNVKIEQPESYSTKMLSLDQIEVETMVENENEEKLKVKTIYHFVIKQNFSFF